MRACVCVCVRVCVCVCVSVRVHTRLYKLNPETIFFFTFTADPTTITKFTLAYKDTQLEVNQNGLIPVEALCEWEEGNPQRRILLRKDCDKPLTTREIIYRRSRVLIHNIYPAHCSDSGQYRCEVEGSDQYRTVTLLVRCKYTLTVGSTGVTCKYTCL